MEPRFDRSSNRTTSEAFPWPTRDARSKKLACRFDSIPVKAATPRSNHQQIPVCVSIHADAGVVSTVALRRPRCRDEHVAPPKPQIRSEPPSLGTGPRHERRAFAAIGHRPTAEASNAPAPTGRHRSLGVSPKLISMADPLSGTP